jgi:hypothetical protein
MNTLANKSSTPLMPSTYDAIKPLIIGSIHATLMNPINNYINHQLDTTNTAANKYDSSLLYRGLLVAKIASSTRIACSIYLNKELNQLFSKANTDVSLAYGPLLAAMMSGFISGLISNPFELIAQKQLLSKTVPEPVVDVIKKIIKTQGPQGLVRGSVATAGRSLFFATGYFVMVPKTTELLQPYAPNTLAAYCSSLLLSSGLLGIPITMLHELRFLKHYEVPPNSKPDSYYNLLRTKNLLSTYKPRAASTALSFLLLSGINEALKAYFCEPPTDESKHFRSPN